MRRLWRGRGTRASPTAPSAQDGRLRWRHEARILGADVVALANVDIGPIQTVGKHTSEDLARYAYVLTRVSGSLLDVGCGHGIFLDAYAGGDRAGVDVIDRGEHEWPFQVADAAALPFPDA